MIHPRIGWGLERRSAQLILLGWTECRTYRQRINPTDPLTWKSQSAWPTGKFGCLLAGPSGPVQQAQAASDLRNTGYRRAHHGLQASSKMGRATRMSRLHPWPARRGLSLKTSQPFLPIQIAPASYHSPISRPAPNTQQSASCCSLSPSSVQTL